MFEKEAKVNEPKYTSCIKINGVPILPPLITHAKRKEIHKYKQQAIKFEKRLKREHELKDYINKYYTSKLENCTNIFFNSTLEHRLSFDNLAFSTSNNGNVTNLVKHEVPFAFQKKTPKLSCDLQVSQYANNEFTVLTDFEKSKSNIIVIDEPAPYIIDSFAYSSNALENEVEESEIINQKPRLIRSNSYVLETPSPMLLEHLQKHNDSVDDKSMPLSNAGNSGINYTHESRVSSADLQALRKTQDCDSIYVDDLSNRDVLSVSRTDSELKNITFSDQISDNGDLTTIESQHQLKEFIDNNLPRMLDKDLFLEDEENGRNEKIQHTSKNENENYFDSSLENFHNTKISLINCDNQSLEEILHNIPEVYSKQIIELLEKQKQEQLIKAKMQHQYFSNYDTKIETDHKTNSCICQKEQTINSLPNLEQNVRNRIIEPQDSSLTNEYNISNNEKSVTLSEHINIISGNSNPLCNMTYSNCGCELFSNFGRKAKHSFTKDYAASIIVAAAKGYLVRRLMRTDRIQGLIQTIRDALVCAVQLHSESSETINESDVKLHRRLLQQVSAACFEFHDVFFSLSVSERMTIVRNDRHRQKEKLKRPLSRASSVSKSSRSSFVAK